MNPVVQRKDDLLDLAAKIKAATEPIALDTETNGLFPMEDKIIGFSVAFSEVEGYYIPVNHINSLNIPYRLVQQLFQLLSLKKLILHNAIFDLGFVATNYGVKLPVYADTMAMAYLACFPDLALKKIMKSFFNEDVVEFEDLLAEKYGKDWASKGYTAAHLIVEDIWQYAVKDVLFAYKLFNALKDEMVKYKSIFKLEMNLIPIVLKMNLEGLEIDSPYLRSLSEKAKAKVGEYLREMREVAGEDFEPNSARQVSHVIFDQLGLPVLQRSKKTGAPSTAAEVMEQLQYMHPFCKTIMEYRSMNKYISGYLDKIPDIVDHTKKLYASFRSLGADSGRFTCPGSSNYEGRDVTVNLQNQPVNEEFDVRKAYVAPEGWVFVKADFSQIEYRMMCNISGETGAIEKFNAGVDFHSATARFMLDIPEDQELTRDERQLGKVLNFGMSYGMTVATVARMIGKTEAEAQELYNKYFENLPHLAALIQQCSEKVRAEKAITTIFGRLRKLEWEGLPTRVAEDTIKKGFNTLIQGSCADILKMAILRVNTRVLKKWTHDVVRLVLTVHDELDFYVREDKLFEVMRDIKAAMEIPTPDNWCNFVCDLEYGRSWSEEEHEDYKPTAEEYQPDPFTGWANTVPEEYKTFIADPDYVVAWE